MSKALDYALRLLTRREHGRQELLNKLLSKGHSLEESTEALDECLRLALQSDARYAHMLCRARIEQGYGPVRIRQELQTRGIAAELIEAALIEEADWDGQVFKVWQKKFKTSELPAFPELQKQQRFLQYRGFPQDLISSLFKMISQQQ